MSYLPFLFPAVWLMWALAFPGVRTATTAQKNPVFWKYPTQSVNGNNPPSQRVHEGGGWRLGALVTVAVQVAIGLAALELIGTLIAQLAALPLVFIVTRRFIDIAEHGAEIMHAQANGFPGYREAEALRMTAKGQEYERMRVGQFLAAVDKKRWLSRIIVKLGAW
ncbi:MAG: hypothetical protein CL955_06870 [Erythrobacteraceae bacterium]|nr:hypothetical protein [Erythrobacteraceae bacterium]